MKMNFDVLMRKIFFKENKACIGMWINYSQTVYIFLLTIICKLNNLHRKRIMDRKEVNMHSLEYEMAKTIFQLRQKCYTKDMFFVHAFNITLAEYNCLVLFFSRDVYGVKELAAALDITPGGVTRIVTSLEKKGIVKRRIAQEDRRNINVSLTKKGLAMVQKLREASVEIHGKILERMDEEHREPVLFALKQLGEAIDAWVVGHKQNKKRKK